MNEPIAEMVRGEKGRLIGWFLWWPQTRHPWPTREIRYYHASKNVAVFDLERLHKQEPRYYHEDR
jgi:hypothetical protein